MDMISIRQEYKVPHLEIRKVARKKKSIFKQNWIGVKNWIKGLEKLISESILAWPL